MFDCIARSEIKVVKSRERGEVPFLVRSCDPILCTDSSNPVIIKATNNWFASSTRFFPILQSTHYKAYPIIFNPPTLSPFLLLFFTPFAHNAAQWRLIKSPHHLNFPGIFLSILFFATNRIPLHFGPWRHWRPTEWSTPTRSKCAESAGCCVAAAAAHAPHVVVASVVVVGRSGRRRRSPCCSVVFVVYSSFSVYFFVFVF